MVAPCPCEFSLSYPFGRRIFAIIPSNYIPCLSYTLHIGPWFIEKRSVYPFLLLHVVQKTTYANHPIINIATPTGKNQCTFRRLPWYLAQSSKLIKERYGMVGPTLQDHEVPIMKTWNPVGDLVWNGIAFMVPPSGSGNHFQRYTDGPWPVVTMVFHISYVLWFLAVFFGGAGFSQEKR